MGPTAKPLALTLGDPAGIGPDVTLLAFAARNREAIPPFVLIGDESVLAERAETLGLSVPIATITAPADAGRIFPDALPVLPIAVLGSVVAGQPNLEAMDAVKHSIETAVGLVQEGEARAVVTNPVSKSHLYRAGFAFPGHTEYLAALASGEATPLRPVMMLVAGPFKVVPTTIHIPLKDVERTLTRDLLAETIKITDRDLRRFFGYERPRLAITGLNPHAVRRWRSSSRSSPKRRAKVSTCRGPTPPTRCSTRPRASVTTRRSACITTRRWCPSRRLPSRRA